MRSHVAAAVATGLALALSGCQSGGTEPTFSDAAVHDPDHILVDDTHYVIGSHLQVASAPDLLRWSQVAEGVNADNPLFEDVTEELSEALEWAETSTLWAPDIIQLSDGRFYLYYDACRGDSPLSAMGIAVADEVTGPYEDQGLILKSGMRGESEDGTPYDARIHPNVIDPDVFHDTDGRLWMAYGSFSGGLFILELDRATGFPLPDQGYGTHLWGGNHSRIEGPAVFVDEATGYYYLFVTYGGLDANAGYNIRVARATSPDGPYLDAEGRDMAEVKSDPDLPLFDDATIAESAVKLMGNHRFTSGSKDGERVSGYVSPGGSSAFVDEDSGERMLVFHTRFPGLGESHQLRVHEWGIDADGWPVIAPLRYAGQPDRDPRAADVPGTYTLVDHAPRTISSRLAEPEEITLSDGGVVAGDREGTWELEGDTRLLLSIDGERVSAELSRNWDPDQAAWVTTFSGLAAPGTALWGVGHG